MSLDRCACRAGCVACFASMGVPARPARRRPAAPTRCGSSSGSTSRGPTAASGTSTRESHSPAADAGPRSSTGSRSSPGSRGRRCWGSSSTTTSQTRRPCDRRESRPWIVAGGRSARVFPTTASGSGRSRTASETDCLMRCGGAARPADSCGRWASTGSATPMPEQKTGRAPGGDPAGRKIRERRPRHSGHGTSRSTLTCTP